MKKNNGRRTIYTCTLLASGWLSAGGLAGDFDGDGFDDVAVGAPFDSAVVNRPNSGTVTIIRGSAAGLTAQGSLVLSLETPGVPGDVASEDNFGRAIAVGNFDGDGFADLAVGVPRRRIDGVSAAGQVVIFFGSAAGLTGTGAQVISQNTLGVPDSCELADEFGAVLAAGDFNGDGFDDLAAGVPGENSGGLARAGAVAVMYGSANGLVASGSQLWSQDSAGIVDAAEQDDRFGRALAAGDFQADGIDDLAIGVPNEGIAVLGQGAVNVIYGSANRLSSAGNQRWNQDSGGIADQAEANDHFGAALAAAEFGNGVGEDLAIGVPNENLSVADAGLVHVIYGSPNRLSAGGSQVFSQNSAGILDQEEINDRFGTTLGAGRIGSDNFRDLVVGVPSEDIGAIVDAGAIHVLDGSAAGLTEVGDQFLHQDIAGILGAAGESDNFGFALALTEGVSINGDGLSDLVVGVPGEDANSPDSGAMMVIPGAATGLSTVGDQYFDQETPGIGGDSEDTDRWGTSAAAR